jgi:AraC-like DNA-binding protein
LIEYSVGDSTYETFGDDYTIGPSVWPHFDLIFVHDGRLHLQLLGKTSVRLRSGQAILIYPGTLFAGRSVTPQTRASVTYFKIRSDETSLPETFARLAGRTSGFEVHNCKQHPMIEADIDRLISLSNTPPSPSLHDMLLALLTLIMGQLHPQPPLDLRAGQHPETPSREFHSLALWLRENLHRSLTLKDMAQFTGLSLSHFRAQFGRVFGESPGRFLLSLRMHEARLLLVQTDLPIKEIARRVGYPEISHFYRAFTRTSNETPHTWRKKYARPEWQHMRQRTQSGKPNRLQSSGNKPHHIKDH